MQGPPRREHVSKRRSTERPPVIAGGGVCCLRKMLGSLPIVASYLERAGMAEIVSAVCPVATQAILSHGDVIAAMIANRLSAPRPLYRVEEWAEEYAVKECLGIHSHLLNDYRCGEALDALAPKGDEVQTAISLRVAAEFKLEMKQIHVDFTPVVFHGVTSTD